MKTKNIPLTAKTIIQKEIKNLLSEVLDNILVRPFFDK